MEASFALKGYHILDATFRFLEKPEKINIAFSPSGEFNQADRTFRLVLNFTATPTESTQPILEVTIQAIFEFQSEISFNTIPTYFYQNSIAIIYPYLRAFVSTLTLQANVPALILPTMNLMGLGDTLRINSKTV